MGVDLLSIGKSGLFSSKKALETAGHNVSNANTEGYSRQRVHQESRPPIGSGNIVQGSGSQVKDVNRVHNEYVEKRLNSNTTDSHYFKELNFQLGQVEEIFNEVNSEGMNKILNRFFNSFRDLANRPEDETVRSIVRENARLVSSDFNRISSNLREISERIDNKIKGSVAEINSMLHSVAKLNSDIRRLEITHGETGDLRDQRDNIIRELSEFMEIQTYPDEKDQLVINARGVGSLVTGTEVQELMASRSSLEKSSKGDAGSMEVFYASRPAFPISKLFKKGKIGALLTTRNEHLTSLENKVDELAYHVANTVNAIHRRGFVQKPIQMDAQGRAIASGKITGIDFFAKPSEKKGAAASLQVSKEVLDDVRNITTALAPNRPGDNRVSLAISKLQHEKILAEGTTSFEEEYLSSVGKIGLLSAKSRIDQEQADGLLVQAESIRERISGVSLDEEAANMIKFQQAYDAAAKVLKTADEMTQTILAIKR